MYDYYIEPLRGAGAAPVVLVPVGSGGVEAVVAGIDGLLLAGGEDVDPANYGADPSPQAKPADGERDAFEIALARRAVETGTPVLAICRGLQLLNVALGGTLVQHLADADAHDRWTEPHTDVHTVVLDADSRVGEIVADAGAARDGDGVQLAVNSIHHQGVERLGNGLVPVGRHPESGLVEAVEGESDDFCIGIQWHAEMLAHGAGTDHASPHLALMQAFVDAARAGSRLDRENEFV